MFYFSLRGKLQITLKPVPVDGAAEILLQELKGVAPVSQPTPTSKGTPGFLRDNLTMTRTGEGEWSYSGPDYVRFVLEGTRRHQIRPRRDSAAMYLRFYWPKAGNIVFYASVMHPGTKPNDFRQPAMEHAEPQIHALMQSWIADMLR